MTIMESSIGFDESKLDNSSFYIRGNNQLTKVKIADIQWVSADGNYCYLYTLQKKYAVKISMKKLATRLSPKYFVQIHKSHIVQLNVIDLVDMKENFVRISETNLPMGRMYKDKLLLRLDIL